MANEGLIEKGDLRPDSLLVFFYSKFWDLLETDVMAMMGNSIKKVAKWRASTKCG